MLQPSMVCWNLSKSGTCYHCIGTAIVDCWVETTMSARSHGWVQRPRDVLRHKSIYRRNRDSKPNYIVFVPFVQLLVNVRFQARTDPPTKHNLDWNVCVDDINQCSKTGQLRCQSKFVSAKCLSLRIYLLESEKFRNSNNIGASE